MTRRQFGRLAAITGGAIALPGAATAGEVSSSKLTDFYEFVVTHTPDDYAVSTLIHLKDESGFDDLESAEIDIRTTTEPEVAAWAELTAEEVDAVVEIDAVTKLEFTHGANPFWRLGGYPDGVVFPDPMDSVDHIGYDEAVAGLQHLEEEHFERLRVQAIGESPGFYNQYTEEYAGEEVMVAELTNDVLDEESFEEKPKTVAVLSIHGDERSGVEGGIRFIEDLLNGEYPEVEELLDDIALVFLFPNPDGWLLGEPQYTRAEGDSIADHLDENTRGNAGQGDTNRQYPTLGMIDPGNSPSEPDGANLVDDEPWIDDDVPEEIRENMPDGLAITEKLRGYENLEYAVDLHNMGWGEVYCYGFVINGEYDLEHLNATFELNRRLVPQFENEVAGLLEERRDTLLEYLDEDEDSDVATEPFVYGTLLSTLGYSTTGSLMGWMSQDPEMGGLGVKTLAYELPAVNPFHPELVDINATAYEIVLRESALHTAREVDVDVETGGATTAYVTTDDLTRTSESLSFVGAEQETTTEVETVGRKWETATVEVAPDTRSLSVTLDADRDNLMARLYDPSGSKVAEVDQTEDSGERVEWYKSDPDPGAWTIRMQNLKKPEDNDVVITIDTVLAEGSGVDAPDPRDALGYQQRNYESTPFEFFEHYGRIVDGLPPEPKKENGGKGDDGGKGGDGGCGCGGGSSGNADGSESLDPVTVEEVRDGALFQEDNGNPAYDNLVVIHSGGADDDAYLEALNQFVDAGGNVVLTDTGVELLAGMDNGAVDDISSDAISEMEVYVAQLTEKNMNHPLLTSTRDNWRELWKPTPLGYPPDFDGASPVTVVDELAFERAGGFAAGYTHENVFEPVPEDAPVSLGTFFGDEDGAVHVVAGMLPPANQTELHPFGMEDYTASYFIQTVLTNALGYRQHRIVDGETVLTLGN